MLAKPNRIVYVVIDIMNEDDIKHVIENLKGNNVSKKIQAARDLGNAAGDDKTDITQAKDVLIQCLDNEDESLRASSVMALYNATDTGLDLTDKISELKKAINDSALGVRYY